MTVGFDAFATHPTGGTGNLTFTPAGIGASIAGAVVKVYELSATRGVTGVTYGGNAMTLLGEVSKASGEAGTVSAWGLFSSVPGGSQEIVVSVTGANQRNAVVNTYTGGDDLELVDLVTVSGDSVADPAAALELGGVDSAISLAFVSGQGSINNVTPFAGWTADQEVDAGAQVAGVYAYDTIGTADVSAGLTQTADDIVLLALAVAEVSGGGSTTVTPEDVATSVTVDNATMTEAQAVSPVDIAASVSVENSSLVASSVLQPEDIGIGVAIDLGTGAYTPFLDADDVAVAVGVENASIELAAALTPQDVAVSTAVEAAALTEAANATPQEIGLALAVDAAALTEAASVAPDDIALGLTVENVSTAVGANVSGEDIALALVVDNTDLMSLSVSASYESLTSVVITLNGTWPASGKTVTYGGAALNVTAQDASSITVDWPLLPNHGAYIRYNEDATLEVTGNGSASAEVASTPPAAYNFHAITTVGGIYADDIGVEIGDISLGYATVGALTVDSDGVVTATTLPAVFRYWLDDGTSWEGPADETFTNGQDVLGLDVSIALSVDNAAITESSVLQPEDIAISVALEDPDTALADSISPLDVALSLVVDNATATQAGAASPEDISLGTLVALATISESVTISPQALAVGLTVDPSALSAADLLTPEDIQVQALVDASDLVAAGVLVPLDLATALTVDTGALMLPSIVLPDGRTFIVIAESRTWRVAADDRAN